MSPRTLMILAGLVVVCVGAGMAYAINVADHTDPQRAVRKIELPNAFKS